MFLEGSPPQLAHAFPLVLFLYVAYRATTPWLRRAPLFECAAAVAAAPFGRASFREGFAGDVLTSAVKPALDLAFALLYFLRGVGGWYSPRAAWGGALDPSGLGPGGGTGGAGGLAATGVNPFATDLIEATPLYRRVLVPALTLLPLWWRFVQCLQRCHETRERWPHIGNALKCVLQFRVS